MNKDECRVGVPFFLTTGTRCLFGLEFGHNLKLQCITVAGSLTLVHSPICCCRDDVTRTSLRCCEVTRNVVKSFGSDAFTFQLYC